MQYSWYLIVQLDCTIPLFFAFCRSITRTDLDLSHVTSRVIAMSYPAEGLESAYRNHVEDVKGNWSISLIYHCSNSWMIKGRYIVRKKLNGIAVKLFTLFSSWLQPCIFFQLSLLNLLLLSGRLFLLLYCITFLLPVCLVYIWLFICLLC